MRILAGTDDGLHLIRWLEGEKSGTTVSRSFEGQPVSSIVRAPEAVIAAVPGLGLQRSVDGGATWEPLDERLAGSDVRTLAAAPTGELVAGTEPAALFVSTDAGSSFTPLDAFAALGDSERWASYGGRKAHVEAIAFDPHDTNRMYAGVEIGGVYRSDDRGASWFGVNEGVFDDVHDLSVDPRKGSRVFAATGGGLYVSSDRGADWRPVPGELGGRYCTCLFSLASTPVTEPSESLFLVGTANGPPSSWGKRSAKAGARLWFSHDSGRNWEPSTQHGARDATPISAFAANPHQQAAVLAGTVGGHLLHGHLAEDHWHQIDYGLGSVHSLVVV
ncbi:MAG: WD40/YVTN/BNR-like repeat-containing protein [Gemmatimonadota bacterium]